jgi:hypothetical protein
LDDGTPETVTYQDDIVEVVLPNARDDRIDAVPMFDPETRYTGAMTGQGRGAGAVPVHAEEMTDFIPCPTGMPSPMTKYKRFAHMKL